MALTKIVKGMLADGSVQPSNLVNTGTYTVGGLTSTGNISVTGNVSLSQTLTASGASISGTLNAGSINTTGGIASGEGLSFKTTATVVGGAGLKVEGLRLSASTWLAFYNTSTKEITYGPGPSSTGTIQVFDQNLNTNDNVRFNGITASTSSFTNINLNGLLTSTAGAGFRVAGIRSAVSNRILMYNSLTGEITHFNSPGQELFTTSSVTFGSVQITNTLRAAGNTYPTNFGTNGQVLTTNGSGTLSFQNVPNPFDQTLNTTNDAQFVNLTLVSEAFDTAEGPDLNFRDSQGDQRGRITGGNPRPSDSGNNFGQLDIRAPRAVSISAEKAGAISDPDAARIEVISRVEGASPADPSPGNIVSIKTRSDAFGAWSTWTFINRVLTVPGNIVPEVNNQIDLGTTTRRYRNGYIRTLFVNNSTIYFEDDNFENTSTLSLNTGTISVDGVDYVDQPLTQTSTPTFATVNATSVDLTSLTAVNATITNLTVLGTMTTLNVTTENVTTENIVTQNYADGSSQTTAWTGTVANSQITSVSTSKVNGLSIVGWSNQYGDLTGRPNQDLNTSSTVTFQHVRTANTLTFAGAVARMAGVRLASFITPGVVGNILFYNTATGETGWFPGPNQQVSTGSVVTFAGVTTTNITVRGSVVFNDATTQATTGQTTVYARNALPSGTTGRIITISDSGSDLNAPAGNYAPAYWDPDAGDWTYIGNSNSVTPT